MLARRASPLLLVVLLLASCNSTNPANLPSAYPTYDPFVPVQGNGLDLGNSLTLQPVPTRTAGPTPTLAPLTVLIPTRKPNAPLVTPTADHPHPLPTARQVAQQYIVTAGDT